MAEDIFAFLHLEGIEGEAEDSKFKNHLALQSVGWGATNNSSYAQGTGSTPDTKGHLHDISFSKYLCKGSLRLLERALSGKPIKKGKLSLVKMVGETKFAYFEVNLEDVVVTACHISAGGSGILPMESCTISYVVAKSEYKPQKNEGDASGKIAFGWNTQTNEAC
jgi:type VI secretion system secreted protein Hcp